ncbi:f4c8bcf1-b867-429f-82be-12c83ab238ca [Thermothielavioides terrestris]|uniref:F4c8bcf1-b867-429f-82be-12c83ab238ca n=1 Tax=Thermothielavioides terrestris TaxID=2587410 RepID=A0A446BV54_9PEZI|nr:f4c8bcf1-b867-429f-82be-12c83ab238ca [Thermothielavioides terrestris]
MANIDFARLGRTFTSTIHNDTYPAINPAVHPAPCAGKTVLITGAAKGLGRAIAVSYAKAGASRIAITARDDASETHAAAQQAAADAGRADVQLLVLPLDVTSRASAEACAAELRRRGGGWERVDVLVNNAAYLAPFEPLAASNPDAWWHTWEVNVRGVYEVARAFLPLVLDSAAKTVVNVVSAGALALTPGASAYQTSKLAVVRLGEYLMADYGSQGLIVHSVHPASVPTDLARNMPEEFVKVLCNDKPELAGDSIVYLTSKRREWLAGRYISCTWDFPELEKREQEIVERNLLKLQMNF